MGMEAPRPLVLPLYLGSRDEGSISAPDPPRDYASRGWSYQKLYHMIVHECTDEPLIETRTAYWR
jgi:hypothetical protein